MPRPLKATAKQVQRSRRDWYALHYEMRQKALVTPPSQVQVYITACGYTNPPVMTIFGGLSPDFPERRAYEVAAAWKLDINLINPWYLTNQGWAEFQALWQQLPEPADIYPGQNCTHPCVQVGNLYTLYTMPDEAKAVGRA